MYTFESFLYPKDGVKKLLYQEVEWAQIVILHDNKHERLELAIKHVWVHVSEITSEYCKGLVHGMPRCLQAVIMNKEDTKY